MSLERVFSSSAAAQADPGEVSALATKFRTLSGQADEAATSLRSHVGLEWSGQAASMFMENVGALPGDLDKVQASFGDAASALSTYSGALEGILNRARPLATRLYGLDDDISNARYRLSTMAHDDPARSQVKAQLDDYEYSLKTAEGTASTLRGELSDAAGACVTALKGAGAVGITNTWYHGIERVGKTIGKFIADPVVEFYKATEAFIKDPSWATFAKVLSTSAALIGEIAAVVALVALTGLTGGADVPVILAVAGVAGAVLGAGAAAADGVALSKHEKGVSGTDLVTDSLGAVLSLATAGAGAALGRQALKSGVENEAGQYSQSVLKRGIADLNAGDVMDKGVSSIEEKQFSKFLKLPVVSRDANGTFKFPAIRFVEKDFNSVMSPNKLMKFTITHEFARRSDQLFSAGQNILDVRQDWDSSGAPVKHGVAN